MGTQLLSAKIAIIEEEPRVRAIQGAPTAVTGAVGITERGPVGVATLVQSFEEYVRVFGGYTADSDVALAAQCFFDNEGQQLWVTRTVHFTDILDADSKTSEAADVTIQTDALASSAGFIVGTQLEPFALTPGDTVIVDVDAPGSPLTATIDAAAASRESTDAETYALANNDTLTVKIDGGAVQTVTFLTAQFVAIGAATAEEVAAVINASLTGASAFASSSGTKITIRSDKRGTGSHVEVTGGTANAELNFNTAVANGTGDVADIDAVTVAELKTVIEADVAGVTVSNVGGAVKIASNTLGSTSAIQITAGSTADDELGFDNATHSGNDAGALDTLLVEGKTDGTYANDLKPKVEAATSGSASEFNFSILKNGVVQELFANVTMDDTLSNYIETVVNDAKTGSNLVTVTDLDAATSSPNDRPANGSYTMSGGDDGLSGLDDTDFIGSSVSHVGIRAFDTVDTLRLLIVPGRATSAVHNAMVTYSEVTRAMTVFAVLDPPAGQTAAQMVTYVKTTAALKELTEFAAIYWPRVKISNPSKSVFGSADQITVAPSGAICGLYAANDALPGGVYEAPAGIEFGKLEGVIGLETDEVLDETKRDLVFPELINPITSLPGTNIHIDGARTLKSTSNFPTIGERRGVIFIETSIQNGLLFAKHRKIKPALLAQLDRAVRAFLLIQLRVGAFASDDPKTAYFVDFSKALNPPSEGFVKKVNGRIGLATAKPAEFIVIRVSQDQRALEEELAKAA